MGWLVLLAAALAALCTGVSAIPDPCIPGNYKEINDMHRSTNYNMVPSESGVCDSGLPYGWYRFTAPTGGDMPEHCVTRKRCGTMAPIWLSGGHPTVGEGLVGRTACVNRDGGSSCCDLSVDIGVKNCSGFYVYYLKPTDSCPIAYCAGDKTPCPGGQWSALGVAPCIKVYPIMTTHPTLSLPEVHGHAFRYGCSINHPEQDPDLVFEVQWTFDGQPDTNIPDRQVLGTSHPPRVNYLPGSALAGHMGHQVACRVRAWYRHRPVVQKSEWRNSTESHYAGIIVDHPHVTVDEKGNSTTIHLTSTVPIVCDHDVTAACCVYIKLDVNGPKNNIAVAHPCSYKLCSSDWDPVTHTATREITIAATKDQIQDGDKQMVLTFQMIQASGGGPYLDVFSGYHVSDVRVTAKDADSHRCLWTGDPHYTSFSNDHFHLFEVGDFTVYENPDDHFELQSRLQLCGPSGAACQCGIAIREHDDVIRIDGCADLNHAPVVSTNLPLRPGTVVQQSSDGHHVMVYLPSGREVRIDTAAHWGVQHGYHNAYLTVPGSDMGHGRGICGTLDSRTDNEFTHRNGTVESRSHACPGTGSCFPVGLAQSWRNEHATSLFYTLPAPLAVKEPEPHYCQCDNGITGAPTVNCSVAADIARFQRCGGNPCVDTTSGLSFLNPAQWQNNGRRSTENLYLDLDVEDQPADFHQTPKRLARRDATWPTPSGITEAAARARCARDIQGAQLYSYCQPGSIAYDHNFENCVMDVLYMDTYEAVRLSTSAFTAFCQLDLLMKPSSYNTDADGNLVLKPGLAEVCSPNCFHHGSCVSGRCVCDAGFSGDYCQLIADTPPTLTAVRGSSECDINAAPCQKVFLDADNFELGRNFVCRIFTVTDDGSVLDNFVEKPAQFISGNRLACPLPDANVKTENSIKTWSVRVTSDGDLFSNPMTFTVYDSTCRTCTGSECTQKPGTCLIANRCYTHNDVNPNDPAQACVAESSSTSQGWSSVHIG